MRNRRAFDPRGNRAPPPPRAKARGWKGHKPRLGSLALAERGFNYGNGATAGATSIPSPACGRGVRWPAGDADGWHDIRPHPPNRVRLVDRLQRRRAGHADAGQALLPAAAYERPPQVRLLAP